MNVTVDLSNASSAAWIPDQKELVLWSQTALECARFDGDAEVSLRLVDEEEGRQLNLDYRGKDYATNVLSFPVQLKGVASDQAQLLGDIVICPAVVDAEAREQSKQLHQHWAHLHIHGILHLLGFEHEDEASAEVMEALEIKALQMLGLPNPYLIG